jgi:hypothetical protein
MEHRQKRRLKGIFHSQNLICLFPIPDSRLKFNTVKPTLFFLVIIVLLSTSACKTSNFTELFVQPGGILFQDRFTNATSGWGELASEAGTAGYSDGTYHIVASQPNVNLWSHPGLDFATVRVEVAVFPAAGPLENRMGLICRLVDDKNFYFFVISGDGYYGIGKMKDGQGSILTRDGNMLPSEFIQTGNVPNRVRGDCIGSFLILYVNDQLVASAEDSDFTGGDVGVIAGSFSQPGADVYFDNFTVFKP